MASHHVTCNVTAMSRASSLSKRKIKEKENQKKRNIKSRKINKRKRKMLVSKAFHNIRDGKQLRITECLTLSLIIITNLKLLQKNFFRSKESSLMNYFL